MKKIILALIILTCNATQCDYIIENETPFQINITTKLARGPELKSNQRHILNPVTVGPWKKGKMVQTDVFSIAGRRSRPETGPYLFIRTLEINSNPPIKLYIRSDFNSSGAFRKEGRWLRKFDGKASLSISNKPFFLLFSYYGEVKPAVGKVHASGIYELGKVTYNNQERQLILNISATPHPLDSWFSQPILTFKMV